MCTWSFALFAVCYVVASGCSGHDADKAQQTAAQLTPGVVATINGQPITSDDVERALERGIDGVAPGDREAATKAFIRGKAIAAVAARELTPEDERELQAAVDNEREKLLVAAYAKTAVEPEPVTHQMIDRYYRAHPELFGGRVSKVCEVITTDRPLNDAEQRKLDPLLSEAASRTDWKAWAFELRMTGIPVVHQTGLTSGRLHRALHAQAESLAIGGVSKPMAVLGTPFVLRVTSEERQEPRPLGEVAHEIRLALAPTQLAKAIKQASEQALKQVKVEYSESAPK